MSNDTLSTGRIDPVKAVREAGFAPAVGIGNGTQIFGEHVNLESFREPGDQRGLPRTRQTGDDNSDGAFRHWRAIRP